MSHWREGERHTRVGRFLQYVKEARDGQGKGREEVVEMEGSSAVGGLLEEGAVSWTPGLRLGEFLRARTWKIQEIRVVR